MAIQHTRGNLTLPITGALPAISSFISSVTGWVIDKSVAGELYIHNTATDSTVSYFSIKEVINTSNVSSTLYFYYNTGFDTGLAVDAQPGVATSDAAQIFYHYITIGTNRPTLYAFTGEQDYLILTLASVGETAHFSSYPTVYLGCMSKASTWVGGAVGWGTSCSIAGVDTITRCDEVGYQGWYTTDSGVFSNQHKENLVSTTVHSALGYNQDIRAYSVTNKDIYLDIGNSGYEHVGTLQNYNTGKRPNNYVHERSSYHGTTKAYTIEPRMYQTYIAGLKYLKYPLNTTSFLLVKTE